MSLTSLRHFWDALQSDPNLAANPDKRMTVFKSFFALSNSSPAFIESAARCEGSVWIKIALLGVRDVWSAIRKLAVRNIVMHVDYTRTDGSTIRAKLRTSAVASLLTGSATWFACDGFLLLLQELWTTPSAGLPTSTVGQCVFSSEEAIQLCMNHVLPLAFHTQAAVRAAAANVLRSLSSLPPTADETTTMDACMASVLLQQLPAKLRPDAADHVIEGALGLVLTFSDRASLVQRIIADQCRLGGCEGVLYPLGLHPAASVRQLFADVLARGLTVPAVLQQLWSLHRITETSPEGMSAVLSWRGIESMLLATHSALLSFAVSPEMGLEAYEDDAVDSRTAAGPSPFSLAAWLGELANDATSFEVRRMASQCLPLYLQFIVRKYRASVAMRLAASTTSAEMVCCVYWYVFLKRLAASCEQYDVRVDIDETIGYSLRQSESESEGSDSEIVVLRRAALCILANAYGNAKSSDTNAAWNTVLTLSSNPHTWMLRYLVDSVVSSPTVLDTACIEKLCGLLKTGGKGTSDSIPHVHLTIIKGLALTLTGAKGMRHQLLGFATTEDLRAPCLADGGNDTPDGLTFLSACLDPSCTKPSCAPLRHTPCLSVFKTSDSVLNLGCLPSYRKSIQELFEDSTSLWCSTAAEPKVVDALSNLLLDTFRIADPAFCAKALVFRLDQRYNRSSWVSVATQQCKAEGGNQPPAASVLASSSSWDDDDDDDDMVVSGSNVRVDVQKSLGYLRQLPLESLPLPDDDVAAALRMVSTA